MKTDKWPDETLAQRVAIILEEEGWTQTKLAKEIEAKSPGTVGNWVSGRNKRMAPQFAFTLQTKHKWNSRWVLDRKGPRKLRIRSPEEEEIIETINDLPKDDILALGRFVTRRAT